MSSLRAKLTIAFLSLALVPLAVVTSVLAWLNMEQFEISAKEYRAAVADHAILDVRRVLEQARAELDGVGAALADEERSVAARYESARLQMAKASVIGVVALYDRAGAHVDTLAVEGAEREALPTSLTADQVTKARVDEGLVLPPALFEREGKSVALMPLIRPVFQGADRRLFGYVMTPVDLAAVSASLKEMSERRFGLDPRRLFVIDPEARVVAHGVPETVGQSVASRGLLRDVDDLPGALRHDVAYSGDYELGGEPVLGVLTPLPELRVGVVVEQPASAAYAAIRRTLHIALAVGLLAAIFALVLGVMVARQLAAPIAAVSRAAGLVAGGDFEIQVEERKGKDEIAGLGRAFNKMTTDLKGYEARVKEEARIRTDLGRYLGPELLDGVVSGSVDLSLGGERREVTVLFADVVSFTPFSEEWPPEDVVTFLNEMFTFQTELVFRNGGIVDKFIGDCVMAVFGLPLPLEDHADMALKTAREMNRWMAAGNARWKRRYGREMKLSIGLNSGAAVAGNIGSKKRMEYTVIGNVVNVAARLQGVARPGQVLTSAATVAATRGEHTLRQIGERELKGLSEAVDVYELGT